MLRVSTLLRPFRSGARVRVARPPRLFVACATGMLTGALLLVRPAHAETFTEVLGRLADHPRLAAAAATARAAEADVAGARAPARPQVSLVGDAGWSRSGLTSRSDSAVLPGVRASQLLFDGGRTGAEVDRRRYRAEALDTTRERELNDLTVRAVDAFLIWARERALLAVADAQVAALTDLQSTVQAIAGYDRGRASDVALVATRRSQVEAARDSRRVAIADARAALRQALAADVEPEGDVPEVVAFLPKTLEQALAEAESRPEARISELEVRQASADVAAARAWWRPRVSVDAGSESESSLDGRTKLFGTVELKLRSTLSPIDGGAGSSRIASAKATASAAHLEAAFTDRAIRDEVVRQWTAVSERRLRLHALTDLVANTDASRDVVAEQFKIGRRSILDLLSFELDRFAARAQLEAERRDYLAAQYRLLAATGRLSAVFLPELVASMKGGGA